MQFSKCLVGYVHLAAYCRYAFAKGGECCLQFADVRRHVLHCLTELLRCAVNSSLNFFHADVVESVNGALQRCDCILQFSKCLVGYVHLAAYCRHAFTKGGEYCLQFADIRRNLADFQRQITCCIGNCRFQFLFQRRNFGRCSNRGKLSFDLTDFVFQCLLNFRKFTLLFAIAQQCTAECLDGIHYCCVVYKVGDLLAIGAYVGNFRQSVCAVDFHFFNRCCVVDCVQRCSGNNNCRFAFGICSRRNFGDCLLLGLCKSGCAFLSQSVDCVVCGKFAFGNLTDCNNRFAVYQSRNFIGKGNALKRCVQSDVCQSLRFCLFESNFVVDTCCYCVHACRVQFGDLFDKVKVGGDVHLFHFGCSHLCQNVEVVNSACGVSSAFGKFSCVTCNVIGCISGKVLNVHYLPIAGVRFLQNDVVFVHVVAVEVGNFRSACDKHRSFGNFLQSCNHKVFLCADVVHNGFHCHFVDFHLYRAVAVGGNFAVKRTAYRYFAFRCRNSRRERSCGHVDFRLVTAYRTGECSACNVNYRCGGFFSVIGFGDNSAVKCAVVDVCSSVRTFTRGAVRPRPCLHDVFECSAVDFQCIPVENGFLFGVVATAKECTVFDGNCTAVVLDCVESCGECTAVDCEGCRLVVAVFHKRTEIVGAFLALANFHACIYRKVAVVEDCVPGITVCTRCSACFQTSAVHTAVQHCNAVVVQSGFSVRNVVHGAYALYRESAVVGDCVLSVNVGDCLFVEVDCYFLSFGNNNAFGNVAKQRDCFPCGYCVNSRLQGNIAYSVVQSNVLAINNRCVAFFVHRCRVQNTSVGKFRVLRSNSKFAVAYVVVHTFGNYTACKRTARNGNCGNRCSAGFVLYVGFVESLTVGVCSQVLEFATADVDGNGKFCGVLADCDSNTVNGCSTAVGLSSKVRRCADGTAVDIERSCTQLDTAFNADNLASVHRERASACLIDTNCRTDLSAVDFDVCFHRVTAVGVNTDAVGSVNFRTVVYFHCGIVEKQHVETVFTVGIGFCVVEYCLGVVEFRNGTARRVVGKGAIGECVKDILATLRTEQHCRVG